MVEGARLESVYTATYRGFESLPLRQRTELRNKLSPLTIVSRCDLLKTVEFPLFFGGMAIHCSLATYGPLVGKTARLPRASRTLSPVQQPKAPEI